MWLLVILVVLICVVVVVALARDAQRAQPSGPGDSEPSSRGAGPVTSRPPEPEPRSAGAPEIPAADADELATHVRELRRALDEGLLPRDEAVASIVRQAGGRIGDEAAGRLLDDVGSERGEAEREDDA